MSIEKVAIGGVCVGGTCAAGYGVYEFSRAKDLRDLLIKEEPLNGDEETNVWSGLAGKYETEGAANTFTDLTLQTPSESNQNKSKADQLKEKCLSALKTPIENKTQIESLQEPTKAWCTKKSSNFTSLTTTVQQPQPAAGSGTGGATP